MAAVAPIIKAKPQELLIAMTIVFFLNAIAIILFPIIGTYLGMNNFEFGAWSALAIHDTSSVIVSALIFSNESAQVAATLKLGRTIWLIPLILIANWMFNKQAQVTKFPRFILFFILGLICFFEMWMLRKGKSKLVPFIYVLIVSFYNWNPLGKSDEMTFIAGDNFRKLVFDDLSRFLYFFQLMKPIVLSLLLP